MADVIRSAARPASVAPVRARIDVLGLAMSIATAAVVPFGVAAVDLQVRPGLLTGALRPSFNLMGYWEGWALAGIVWFFALESARHPRKAVRIGALIVIALLAAFGIGGQAFFHRITFDYVDRKAMMLAFTTRDVVAAYLREDLRAFILFVTVSAAAVCAVAYGRARLLGPLSPRMPAASLAVAAFVAAMFVPIRGVTGQEIPPDELWFEALGGALLFVTGRAAAPHTLPNGTHRGLPAAAVPVAADAPSIVVILGESIRRDHACPDDGGPCLVGKGIEAAAPNRLIYERASSIASCTEIASVALWTGRPVNTLGIDDAAAPLLFDFAKARGYRTAYLSSQNLIYQRLDAFLRGTRVDLLREARHRKTAASWENGSKDEDTLREAVEFVNAGPPSFVLAHLANTHMPYRQDRIVGNDEVIPTRARPASRDRYITSLRLEDQMLGDFVRALRASPAGPKTIVIYLADHGEEFGEHKKRGHTFNLFATEIDVPVWIDAPAGTIPEDVLARMKGEAQSRYVATQDVSATVVDLVGGFDQPAWAAEVGAMSGRSLLRDPDPSRVVLMTNCPTFRECLHPAFGAVRWPFKYHTEDVSPERICTNLERDPSESEHLPLDRCGDLPQIVATSFRGRTSMPEP